MKDFLKHNGLQILIVALLLAAVTAVASFALGGTANPIANFFGVITTPIRNGVDGVAGWVEGLYSDAFETEQLKEEVERLRQEVADMSEQVREGQAAIKENENFRTILGLAQRRKDFVLELVTVTARSTSNWESTLTISKGSNAGIEADDCVVDPYGNLVGVVTEVGHNYAVVNTIIDTSIDMGGLVFRADAAAILEGDFALMGQGRLKLTYLPENLELIAGDVILTSGRGGVYPSTLVVGKVESIHTDDSGMSQYAVVMPETDLTSLSQVFVIKEFDVVE